MSNAFLFYESVMRNGSVGLMQEGSYGARLHGGGVALSNKASHCLTAELYPFSSVIWDRM